MEFLIMPYQSAGDLRLGRTANEIEMVLGAPKDIKKQSWDNKEIRTYEPCFVYFDENGFCEAIELFKPAKVIFNDRDLLAEPYNVLRQEYELRDKQLDCDEVGFTSHKYGFEVYAPYSEDDPSLAPVSVILFSQGYYGKH